MAEAAIQETQHEGHGHHDHHHQFENYDQQNESYLVGMWTFLVTEVMFFGPLFLCYVLYRWKYQDQFGFIGHHALSWQWGGVNTAVLLVSSYFMALAVHFAQKKDRPKQQLCLLVTILCACTFLFIKLNFEWAVKYANHEVPWANFMWHESAVPENIAKLFFSLYFAMTGLHGIHVVMGIVCIAVIMIMTARKHPLVEDYVPTEMVGLYWHFVDLVWIFLYPLFYLIPK